MLNGSVVICNDLIGTLIKQDEKFCVLRGADGVERRVLKTKVHEVANPHALACLLYKKVSDRRC